MSLIDVIEALRPIREYCEYQLKQIKVKELADAKQRWLIAHPLGKSFQKHTVLHNLIAEHGETITAYDSAISALETHNNDAERFDQLRNSWERSKQLIRHDSRFNAASLYALDQWDVLIKTETNPEKQAAIIANAFTACGDTHVIHPLLNPHHLVWP